MCSLRSVRAKLASLVLVAWLPLQPSNAAAATPEAERALSSDEITRWLDRPTTESTEDRPSPAADEAPPAPPRHHGFVIETGVGALAHLGPLEHVTPLSPRFHVQVGYEPFKFLTVFGEGDLTFSTTSYARRPPPPRSYGLYGFGAGLRLTLAFIDRLGGYLEGSAGMARASEDVLEVYGFRHSTEFSLYFGGRLGLEWYPVNPHLAVGLWFGARSYAQGFERERSDQMPLALMSGLSLRYTF